ncbi:AlpA family transcriptional regulator [Histophilus somni]|uniref:AlpA family transcriptional regulator n=2 Tax=Histophilus somni TaxID=731 RepID=A0A9Q6Z1N4_HISSO|nr:AlpA family transcriptional regulator [Histophilus somni]MBN6711469.1 AlpA family transcriptional regulator [Canicola haemoglobinophilus]ARU64341.1 AlpA family transcriptional regulator [Histophilus somni]ARU66128.1 AlpA family transcriptional regulator [Histophilus somni]ARU68002.1 AlpA family transcriptional regulator [Histophilus somni]ARU69882.1 AlpA family transcriptional regulator [Histophilus somni]
MERILRIKDVCQKTGLPRSTIYARIKQGTFPAQLKLGARSSGWKESELDLWIEQIQSARPE